MPAEPAAAASLKRTALRATFWSAAQQAGARGLGLPIFLVLARLLAPDAFGVMALALVFVDFLLLSMQHGIATAIVQRDELEPEHLDSAFWGNLALACALALAGLAAAPLFARAVGEPEVTPVARWLSLVFPLAAARSVPDAVLRRGLEFKALAVRALVSQVLAGAGAIALAVLGGGVWSLVVLVLVAQAVSVPLVWRAVDWRPRLRFSLARYRELFGFGAAMTGVQSLRFLRDRTDHFLIGAALGAVPLGFYSVARQLIGGVMALLVGAIGPVAWPMLSRLQRERERLGRAIYQAVEMLAVVTLPAYLGIAALAPEIVKVILGERWLPSVPLVRAFVLAAVVLGASALVQSAAGAVGDVRLRIRMELLVAALTLVAIGTALSFGIVAVAWAVAGALLVSLPLQLAMASRVLPIAIGAYLARFLPAAAASVAMMLAVLGAREALEPHLSGAARLATLVPLGALLYAGFLRAVFPAFTERALENLRSGLASAGRRP